MPTSNSSGSVPTPFYPGHIGSTRRLYGGTPLPLPSVLTLPATSITNTSVFLNGSVNSQGLAGTWWFVYGTTPQYGSSAAVHTASASTIPQTVGVAVSGLTTGATYHVAVVMQTAAGKVYGNDVTFVAATPSIVTSPALVVPSEATQLEAPHLDYPFVLTNAGAVTVEQDSAEEIMACVKVIVACPAGGCPEIPDLGLPDVTFSTPFDPDPVVSAIERLEPRAREEMVVSALGTDEDLGVYEIDLTTITKAG